MMADFGPWTKDDLRATASMHDGAGTDYDLPTVSRFRRNVARLLRRRRNEADARHDLLAVFILDPVPPQSSTYSRVPMLDNGKTEIVGRAWFVGKAVKTGHYFDTPQDSDAAVFDFIRNDLGCGHKVAIVYDPRLEGPEARFYPNGLDHEDCCEIFLIEESDISADSIKRVIERVYKSSLITPDTQVEQESTLWEDSNKHWVSRSSEKFIQGHLKTGLAVRFFDCEVRHERKLATGRVDLEIEKADPLDRLSSTRPAVIEVKVLRSFGSTGRANTLKAILRWIRMGVRQVAAYRDECRASVGILCCFDMRKTDTGDRCFDDVREMAQDLEIMLNRWFLYNSSEAYRTATYR